MSEAIRLRARAKINLTLEILGKRPDGYHNLVSVMQTVELHDTITLTPAPDLTLVCDDPTLENDDNLALVAARAVRDATGVRKGVRIAIEKRVPVAAGLAGGSSDAAAVLRGLNRLWNAGLSESQLASLGASLGSDIPFLLRGGTALVQGKGEDVAPLPDANIDWLVIMSPDIAVENKTARMFLLAGAEQRTRGLLSHKLAGRIRGHGDVPAQFLFNAFDAVADRAFPNFERYRAAFRQVGAREATLTGAGPSMFALAPGREVGLAWQLLLRRRERVRAFLTRAWRPERSAARERS